MSRIARNWLLRCYVYGVVSTQAIRCDILALNKNNLVTHHHGGAGSVSSLDNLSYDVRRISMLEEKRQWPRSGICATFPISSWISAPPEKINDLLTRGKVSLIIPD